MTTDTAVAPAVPAAAAAAPAPAVAGKYYEMRIYTAAAGKMDALNARFRDHTTKLFAKHGIENVGYWVAVDEKNVGKLYYVIAYPDKASRDKLWDAFNKDPEWVKARNESEKDGKLVAKVEQVFMTATDYSAIK
ncbi:MAG: family containing protein [Phycisphaerales bacterium]|nr:family containing protein [Phycisphaerales bacterium]